ncbi:unnamed protein product [Rhizophagus irregularis]|nr:unnamed protein product [Rhizophagus irregularis]
MDFFNCSICGQKFDSFMCKKWDRNDSCNVALKVLEGSKDSTKFLEEVSAYVECAALSIPDNFINILRKCWDPNPFNRPSAYDLFLFDNYGELSVKNDEIFESKYEIHPGAIYTSRELSIYTQSLSQGDDEMIEWNTEKRLEVPGSNYYATKLQNMNDEFGNNLNN